LKVRAIKTKNTNPLLIRRKLYLLNDLKVRLGKTFEENKSRINSKFTNNEMTSNICEISERLSLDLKRCSQKVTAKNSIIKMI